MGIVLWKVVPGCGSFGIEGSSSRTGFCELREMVRILSMKRRLESGFGRMVILTGVILLLIAGLAAAPPAERAPMKNQRQRCRELGITIGVLPPGPLNAITDVDGVRVGHRTLMKAGQVCTGVTAILPHGDNIFQQKVPAAIVLVTVLGNW